MSGYVQFDRQVTHVRFNLQHSDSINILRQLARRGARPRRLALKVWHPTLATNTDTSATATEVGSGDLQQLLSGVTSACMFLDRELLPAAPGIFSVSAKPTSVI
jgi:hypothetical protein